MKIYIVHSMARAGTHFLVQLLLQAHEMALYKNNTDWYFPLTKGSYSYEWFSRDQEKRTWLETKDLRLVPKEKVEQAQCIVLAMENSCGVEWKDQCEASCREEIQSVLGGKAYELILLQNLRSPRNLLASSLRLFSTFLENYREVVQNGMAKQDDIIRNHLHNDHSNDMILCFYDLLVEKNTVMLQHLNQRLELDILTSLNTIQDKVIFSSFPASSKTTNDFQTRYLLYEEDADYRFLFQEAHQENYDRLLETFLHSVSGSREGDPSASVPPIG
jgi:hypothetical protein